MQQYLRQKWPIPHSNFALVASYLSISISIPDMPSVEMFPSLHRDKEHLPQYRAARKYFQEQTLSSMARRMKTKGRIPARKKR